MKDKQQSLSIRFHDEWVKFVKQNGRNPECLYIGSLEWIEMEDTLGPHYITYTAPHEPRFQGVPIILVNKPNYIKFS